VLRITNKGGKSSGGKAVLLGRGGGQHQSAEIQLAQAVTRAASAIRTAEQAVHEHSNNSAPAEAAYDEAEAALESLMTADAALHSGEAVQWMEPVANEERGHRAWAWTSTGTS